MSEVSAPSCTLSELSTDQQPDFPIITETTTIGMPLLFLDNHLAIYQALFPKLSTATTGEYFLTLKFSKEVLILGGFFLKQAHHFIKTMIDVFLNPTFHHI